MASGSFAGEGVNHRPLKEQRRNLMLIPRVVFDVLNNHPNDLSVGHALWHTVSVEGQHIKGVRNTSNVALAGSGTAPLAVFNNKRAIKAVGGKPRRTQKTQNQSKSFHSQTIARPLTESKPTTHASQPVSKRIEVSHHQRTGNLPSAYGSGAFSGVV